MSRSMYIRAVPYIVSVAMAVGFTCSVYLNLKKPVPETIMSSRPPAVVALAKSPLPGNLPVTFNLQKDLQCANPDGSIRLRRHPPDEFFTVRGNTPAPWTLNRDGRTVSGETRISVMPAANGESLVVFTDRRGGQPIARAVPSCPQ